MTSTPTRGSAALAGLVTGGVALGAGELLASLFVAVPSPLAAVGKVVIDVAPRQVREGGIDAFGTADKPALIIGTVLVGLALGALIGLRSRRTALPAVVAFGGFALL